MATTSKEMIDKLKGYGYSNSYLQKLGDRSLQMYLDIIEGRRYPTESQLNSMKTGLENKDPGWVWPWQSEAPSWAKGVFTASAGTLGALAGGAGVGALAAKGVPGALGSVLGTKGTLQAAQGLASLAGHPKLLGAIGGITAPFLADIAGTAITGGGRDTSWLSKLQAAQPTDQTTDTTGTEGTEATDAEGLLDEYISSLLSGEAPKTVEIGGTQYFLDPYQGWVPVSSPNVTAEQELANQLALIEAQKQAEIEQQNIQNQASLRQLYAQNPYLYWAQQQLGLPGTTTTQGQQGTVTSPTSAPQVPQEGVSPALQQAEPAAAWQSMLPNAPGQLASLATPTGITTPSAQQWNRMSPSEQQLVSGAANWLGISPEDWEFFRKRKTPSAGNSGALIRA